MRKLWKKSISIILISCMIILLLAEMYQPIQADTYDSPNVVLLEAMLNGDRHWVLDTLVDDDRAKNPYNNEKSLMATSLSQYVNKDDPDYNALYAAVVNMLKDHYYKHVWTQDFKALLVDYATEVGKIFSSDDAFLDFGNDLRKTAEEEGYDNILVETFSDEYTTSWGESVGDQEEALKTVSELKDKVDSVSKLTTFWKNIYKPGTSEGEAFFNYINEVLNPLMNSGGEYLKNFNKLEGKEKQITASAVVLATSLGTANLLAQSSASCSVTATLTKDLFDYVAGSDVQEMIKGVEKGLELTSGALDQYSFLNRLCQQKEQFHDTLLRVSERADDSGNENMSRVFTQYAKKMDSAIDSNQIGYDMLVKNLSKVNIESKGLKLFQSYREIEKKAKSYYEKSGYKSLAALFDSGMSFIDKLTGLKQVCMGTSELCYLSDIIDQTKSVYESDLNAYNASKTEDNAKKVLNDLQLLQRLRLQGENISYKMSKSQLTSWIGKLASGYNIQDWAKGEEETELSKAWKEHYQNSIDSLIGATLNPVAIKSWHIKNGENLEISYNKDKGTYQGRYTVNSKTKYIYEMQYRLLAGLTVDGGEVNIKDATVPFIYASGDSSVILYGDTAKIGEYTGNDGTTLKIFNGDTGISSPVEFSSIELNNATVKGYGNDISTSDLTCKGNVTIQDTSVQTGSLHATSKANIAGKISCKKNAEFQESQITDLTFNGKTEQQIKGNFTVKNLTLNNTLNSKAIKIENTATINGKLSDPENRAGVLTLNKDASIEGSTVASDLILNDVTVAKNMNYKGSIKTYGNVTLAGGMINGSLTTLGEKVSIGSSGDMVVKNAFLCKNTNVALQSQLKIYGDAYLQNTSRFTGKKDLVAYGDVKIETNNQQEDQQLESLKLCGNVPQEINIGSGTIENLEIDNHSITGTKFIGGNVTVTKSINAKNQMIQNGDLLYLTGNTNVNIDNARCNLTVKDWNGSWNGNLIGTLNLLGSNTFKDKTMEIKGGLLLSDGELVIDHAQITTRGPFRQSKQGKIRINKDSILDIKNDVAGSGTSVENNGKFIAESCRLNNLAGEGQVEISEELYLENESTFRSLRFCGAKPQEVSGKTIYVEQLINDNLSSKGVYLNPQIYVSDRFENHGKIRGTNPILRLKNNVITGELTQGNFVTDQDMKIGDNAKVTINGNAEIGGALDVGTNAEIFIKGNLTIDGKNLQIGKGSKVTVRGNLRCNNSDIILDGHMMIYQDTKLSSGKLEGEGILELRGDLMQNSTINNLGQLSLNGYVPQMISGNEIYAKKLEVQNTSAHGVDIKNQIYYKQKMIRDGIKIDKNNLREETE